MSLPQAGWALLSVPVAAVTATTDSLLIAGAIVGILVAVSTLMIRIFTVIDNRIEGVITKRQADGDLPTKAQTTELLELMREIREAVHDK